MVSIFGVVVRMFVYVAVMGGSSCVLYGVVTSQNKVPATFYGSSCLLFGRVETKSGRVTIDAGAKGWCKFVEFASASQLALAFLMAVVSVFRLMRTRRGSSDGNRSSIGSMIELFFVAPAFLIALAGGIILTAGLGLFCSRASDSVKGYNPSCSDLPVRTSKFEPYFFYKDLNIAQIGMWVTCAWLLHVILCCISTRRGMRSSPNNVDLTGSNTFVSDEKYKKMTDPTM